MRYLFFLLVLLVGCHEKEITPVGHEYQLMSSEMPITLGFNPDGRFYGKAVNNYWGQYHIRKNVISFSGISATMKMGTLPEMRAERAYFQSLENGHTFEIKEDKLKIFFDEKGVLEFQSNTNQMDFQ